MDSPNPLDGTRAGSLMGLGSPPSSSSAAATPSDKKAKKKKNLDTQKTYRFKLSLKSCQSEGKEVTLALYRTQKSCFELKLGCNCFETNRFCSCGVIKGRDLNENLAVL